MNLWEVLGLGAVWLLANAAVLYQLRPENTHARAQARNAYFIHRCGSPSL